MKNNLPHLLQSQLGNLLAAAAGITWLAAGPLAQAAGSFPPTSAPGIPIMKSLAEIEPRTIITALPFNITHSGSYYLTNDLNGQSGQSGIIVYASDVTIDLNGFSVRGVAGSLDGVLASSVDVFGNAMAVDNLTIRNGSIRGWGQDGLNASAAVNTLCLNLHASRNGRIGLRTGQASVVQHCTAYDNSLYGMELGQASTLTDCTAARNGNDGIHAGEACTITRAVVVTNGDDGIEAANASIVTECLSQTNHYGVYLRGSASVIRQCTAVQNSVVGFLVSGEHHRIDSNQAINNLGYGIKIVGSYNLVVRNQVTTQGGSGTDYYFDNWSANKYGPIRLTYGGQITSQTGWENFTTYVIQ